MTDLALPNPLVVLDCREGIWPPPNLEELQDWLRSHGIEPDDTYRVEVYLIDTLFARIFQYARNERGRHYCSNDHGHLDDPDRCVIARREPYTVPLACMPPEFLPASTTEETSHG